MGAELFGPSLPADLELSNMHTIANTSRPKLSPSWFIDTTLPTTQDDITPKRHPKKMHPPYCKDGTSCMDGFQKNGPQIILFAVTPGAKKARRGETRSIQYDTSHHPGPGLSISTHG